MENAARPAYRTGIGTDWLSIVCFAVCSYAGVDSISNENILNNSAEWSRCYDLEIKPKKKKKNWTV